jgi:hypothetical protein
MEHTQRNYWRFYWPLALIGVVAVAGRLGQNRVLLDYEEGTRELALFTLALAIFGPFRSALIFVPQMSNVLVRGPKSFRASGRFLATVCLLLTLPVALLGWTPLGDLVLPRIYNVGPNRIAGIRAYLRYFTPLILMGGATGFLTGLLIQSMRTGMVTVLRIVRIGVLIGSLALGVWCGWQPVVTLSASLMLASAGQLLLAGFLYAKFGRQPPAGEDRWLTQREIAAFFLPMVATTILFATSRPIIFAFLTALNPTGDPALPNVDVMVGAAGLAFTFNMAFQITVNQFRNVMVTFGKRDPAGVRRFVWRVALGLSFVMAVAVASPVVRWFLQDLQNAEGELLRMARQAVWPLVLAPLVVTWRNYLHGLTMVHRRTAGMAAGGLARNASVLICAPLLTALGLYNHVAAAAMLVVAFAAEAGATMFFTRRWRAELA